MPASLVKLFDKTGHKSGYRYVERNILANWRSWAKAPTLYNRVKCPVTLVYGQNDWSSSKERSESSSKIAQSKVEIVPNSGHFLSVDNPTTVNRIIKNL